MGILGKMDDECEEPNATPKLILSKLPCKTRQPIQMLTPPLHPSVSVPFQWEEAPGKPRSAAEEEAAPPPPANPKAARCLDLPPGLLLSDEPRFTVMPSPTTVLDGPYVGRSLSLACTFSFRKGIVTGREDFGPRPGKKIGGRNFGSGRWSGSFREEGKFGRGIIDISPSVGEKNNGKMKRARRRKSFFSLSAISSSLWADIYDSFKQVVPWRRTKP